MRTQRFSMDIAFSWFLAIIIKIMGKTEQEHLYSRMEHSLWLRLWEYAKIIIPLNIGLLL